MKTAKDFVSEKIGDKSVMSLGVSREEIEEWFDEYAKQEWDKFKPLYIAASDLLHLHMSEQEGIGSGMPTAQQWIKAVDKLEKALGLNDKK